MTRISAKVKTLLARALRRATKRPFLKAPIPQPKSRLLSLPPEILLRIVDFADTASVACLALTCKGAYLFVNTPAVFPLLRLDKNTVHNTNPQRRDFLLSYAQDQKDSFFCHRCYRLHHVETASPPGPLFQVRKRGPCLDRLCVRQPWQGGGYGHLFHSFKLDGHGSTYNLKFEHVQLALDEHRRPGSGIPLEALVMNEIVYPRKDSYGNGLYCTLQSFEAAVVEGKLYLRVQQWLVISEKAARKTKKCSDPQAPDVHMCSHISLFSARSAMGCGRPKDWFGQYSNTVYYCSTCDTEWTFETKYIGTGEDDRVALIVSKCYDLGDGLDPNSQK